MSKMGMFGAGRTAKGARSTAGSAGETAAPPPPRRGGPLTLRPSALAGLVELGRQHAADPEAYADFRRLLAQLAQAIQADSVDGQVRMSWGGPMNGQAFRQKMFQKLVRLGVDVIVETGTYLGTSTAYFARQGLPVVSCEASDRFLAAAATHLAELTNVTLHLQDSRAFLKHLAAEPGFGFRFPLFYLDAHWSEDLPLAEEIGIITARWPSFAIMVDDFQVPGARYAYDNYGDGKELSLAYLDRNGVDLSGLAVLFPAAGPDQETGAKRGSVVLMPSEIYEQRLSRDEVFTRHR